MGNENILVQLTSEARSKISNAEVLHYFFNIKKKPFFSVKMVEKTYSYEELIPETKVLWNNREFLIETYDDKKCVVASDKRIEFVGKFFEARKFEANLKKQTGFGFSRLISELKDWKLKDK